MQVSPCRKFLPQLIVIAVGVPKQREIAIVNVDLISNLAPVKTGRLGSCQSEKDQDDQQKNLPRTNSRRPRAISLCLVILHQLDDTPKNNQYRPVMSPDLTQHVPLQHAERS